jgi:hypothetical protein
MTNLKSLAIASLLVGALILPVVANAQNPGQGRGQGRGGMMMGGRGMQSKGMLVARNDVRKDIATTADQNSQIDKLQKDFQAKMQARMEEIRQQMQNGGGGGANMQAMGEEFQKMQKEYDDAILKILDDKQKGRLDQINLQMRGNRALMDEDIQKKLDFKVDQKRKIQELSASMDAANQAIFQRMQNGEIDREQVRPLMEENNKIMDAELAKILNAEQTKMFDEMKGAKFNRDPKDDEAMRNMMGRGGRGGGGN